MFSLGKYLHSRKNVDGVRRRGILPSNLLYIDGEQQRYVWIKKSHRGMIMFDKETKIKDQTITHPTLIFCCHGENLYVYACLTDDPKEGTQLARAPYLNIYSEENLCKGTNSMARVRKAETHQALIDAWEDVFFKSRFSHGIGNAIPHSLKNVSNIAYIKLLAQSKKFPYKSLQKTNKTLKGLFK